MSNVIEIVDLKKRFGSGENEALIYDGANLNIEKGSFVSLTGPSGSGKSTLLYLIGGLDRDFTGAIRIGGKNISGMSDSELSEIRSFKLSYVFQFYNLVANLTVEENILLPYAAHSGECVTCNIVMPFSSLRRLNSFIISSPEDLSRFPVASSARSISGSVRTALAIEHLCC